MLARLIARWIQHSDPEKLRSWVYLIQAGLGALVVLALVMFRNRETPSGFKTRESDRKKPGQKGTKEDPLAQARLAPEAKPLRLSGISIFGAPHEILGISARATVAEIQKAYRELMKQYHPDKVGRPGTREWQDAQKIAEAINQAKEKMLKK